MAVDLATVHHEGGGRPRDDLADPGTKGYTVGIGVTRYTIFRPIAKSFATLNYNHVSFDVLLSGDRNNYPVTQNDLLLIRAAAAEFRRRGELVDAPFVRPHRKSPGSQTICPGNQAAYPDPPTFPAGDALAWVGIVTALHKEAPPMPPALDPEFFPPLAIVSWCQTREGVVGVSADGAVFAIPPAAYHGGANGKPYFAGMTAARIRPSKNPAKVYEIMNTNKQSYAYPE